MIYGLTTFGGEQASKEGMTQVLIASLEELKKFVDHIFLVDDGTGLIAPLYGNQITLGTLPLNVGAAGAFRHGLAMVMKHACPSDIIVQIDYDKDQSPTDIPMLLAQIQLTDADLMIGDRHAIHKQANQYRRHVNFVQMLIARMFGFENTVTDVVSGLRAYSSEFGGKILQHSRSKGWGFSAEMFAIAALTRSNVVTVPLTISRNRDYCTKRLKLIEVFDGILIHEIELSEMGFGPIVNFLTSVRSRLTRKEEQFILDLTELGSEICLQAKLVAKIDAYTFMDSRINTQDAQ